MKLRNRARKIAVASAALLLVLLIAAAIIVQTRWFDEYVRTKIIAYTESATGGKTGIGSFHFDLRHLRATVTGVVLHGTEPAGAAPFLRVAKAEVDFSLFPGLTRLYGITYFDVEGLRINIIELADGRTNIPSPKQKTTPGGNPLQTVVDLAVQRFRLRNCFVAVEARRQSLDVSGNNLQARLSFDAANRSYQGELSLDPVYVVRGRNSPVDFRVTLPVTVQSDRLEIRNGAISTPHSNIALNISIQNMRNPVYTGRVGGSLDLTDLRELADIPLTWERGMPRDISFEADATVSDNRIDVDSLRAAWGGSNVEGSGILKSPARGKPFGFRVQLALDQAGRLLNISEKPEGNAVVTGTASLDAQGRYEVSGNVEARTLSLLNNASLKRGKRTPAIGIASAFHLNPQVLDLTDLRVSAAGGEFTGRGSLQNLTTYTLNGSIHNLNLQELMRGLGQQLPFSGLVSGLVSIEGNLEAPGTKGLSGQAHLSISPGRAGVPVSGQLNATFHGATGTVSLAGAHLNLPHTQITVNGTTNNVTPRVKAPAARVQTPGKLNISVTTTNLNDLLAAASIKGPVPLTLDGGQLTFRGSVSGGLESPRIEGHLAITRFRLEGRFFDDLNADLNATSSQASITNAILARDSMQMHLAASIGLNHWSAPSYETVSADVSIANGDLADVLALAGQRTSGFSGTLNAAAHISGTLGNPQGTANLQIVNGTIESEPFEQLQVQADLTDQRITIPAAYIQAKPGRLTLTADYRHPRDSFTTGQLEANVQSTSINLAEIQAIGHQAVSGAVQINADLSGDITGVPGAPFSLTAVKAALSGSGLRFKGLDYGSLTATASTSARTVTYNLTDNWTTSSIRIHGNTTLATGYPTTAEASLQAVPIGRFLVPAGREDVPVHGELNGAAHFDGTVTNPQGSIDLALSHADVYGQPLSNVTARASWLPGSIDISRFEAVSDAGTITVAGRFDHPAGNLQQGTAQFSVSSSRIELSRIRRLQELVPDFGGTLQLRANGAAQIRGAAPRILLTSFNSELNVNGMRLQNASLGDMTISVATNNSSQLSFVLDSNLGGSSIQGRGNMALTGDYPVNAHLTFSRVSYSRLRPLLRAALGAAAPNAFDAAVDGEAAVSGPLFKPDQLRGSLQLTKLSVSAAPGPGTGKSITISNQGPIALTLAGGVARIQSAHMVGPDTDISAGGSASLSGALDFTLAANVNLAVLPGFLPAVYSSGKVAVTAAVQGTASRPAIDGQLTFDNAAFNYAGITNGLSNLNGVVAFNGTNATIRSLSAVSGGGKVVLTGFVGYTSGLRFGIEAKATGVRVRPQEGISVTAAADLRLTGTAQNSIVAGNVTIEQFTYNPKSDIGAILSSAGPPVTSPSTSPLLADMRLDIQVRSSTGVAVQASLAQNLQADVDLRVRGTVQQPGALGRITIDEGKIVFFGVSYTVNNGTIGFYNPIRIDPVLDVSLETQTQGVHVTVRVTGPIDNMKLSYTSDPPLQFQEIVALLAAGQTPTSDPTLLANQPQVPQQSFEQLGESAIITQSLADPLAERLQRVFGVTQLKVTPAFQAGTQTPTARVTLQQQVSNNITLTYTSALDDPNGLIVSVEWAFSPQYSAVATRDQNGIFSVTFYYKRHFH